MALKDKVALVTGAASGIGEQCARTLAADGAAVVIADLNIANVQKVADDIHAHGGKAISVAMDVTSEEAVNAGIEKAVRQLGSLDVAGFESNALTGQSIVVSHGWFMQ